MSIGDTALGTLASRFDARQPPQSISQLAEALSKAQHEYEVIPKDKTANIRSDKGSYSYLYAELGTILKSVLPKLTKHGLSFTQPLTLRDGKLRVVTRLMHSSGESIQSDGISIPENLNPSEFSRHLGWYRRLDASAFLGVAPEESVEGDSGIGEAAPSPKRGRPPVQKMDNPPVQQSSPSTEREQAPKPSKATSFEFGANEPAPKTDTFDALREVVRKDKFEANDSDVPDNIGDPVPTKEEREKYRETLKGYKVEMAALGKYVKRVGGNEDTSKITKKKWQEILLNLETASKNNLLEELLK